MQPKQAENQDSAEGFANATWQEEQEASIFLSVEAISKGIEKHVMNNAMQQKGVKLDEILVDNAAKISIMCRAANECQSSIEEDSS